ncbi:HpcH/HpaI aldolase/citrate lyase family protein [Bordetella pseudohinzii]|uniref:Citrate lyase subunit beta-like protein n=1 Tax=Bordetella pseudohinzii TaxID=1331258 RepID=A0A0J6C9T6_9BORD|nr:CoA ester lyase [Bordetella pseudohinzii]ANY15118.1 host specificity protein [Bordetella pseudohinzii]KMM26162.1 host specificity protein [Bordetella pseudohinzii]KXA80026.1 host specificity protein [Bordetella pseudohinzii]KXA82888.1 host specificity protein [Bordetella pseudohinzii]CUI52199.1 Citrate lyase subunit beta-like protein [Bordetella pseudohinzii]
MSSVIRTALFVPANRPDRIPKALATGADTVIVDLEDAVEHLAKDSARQALLDFLDAHPDARLWVRINDASTPWHDADLQALRGRATVSGIVLPKAESMAQVRHVAQTNIPVIPIVETAQGVLNLGEIAATPGVQRLAFGSLDYSLDLSMTPDTEGADLVLDHARVQLLLHGRVAGLAQPLYGVFPGIQDTTGLRAAAIRARDMGFGGLLCIHPTQVPVVHEAFLPPLADLEWARQVVRAHRDSGLAAFKLDGKMIDAPVIARARRLLERAGESIPA